MAWNKGFQRAIAAMTGGDDRVIDERDFGSNEAHAMRNDPYYNKFMNEYDDMGRLGTEDGKVDAYYEYSPGSTITANAGGPLKAPNKRADVMFDPHANVEDTGVEHGPMYVQDTGMVHGPENKKDNRSLVQKALDAMKVDYASTDAAGKLRKKNIEAWKARQEKGRDAYRNLGKLNLLSYGMPSNPWGGK